MAVILTTAAYQSCTYESCTDEMIEGVALRCYNDYVSRYSYRVNTYGSYDSTYKFVLLDTIAVDSHIISNPSCDSCNVFTSFRQDADGCSIRTDGYEYGTNIKAHLFTTGSGIIDGDGEFHVDFYYRQASQPWAWSHFTIKGYSIVLKEHGKY